MRSKKKSKMNKKLTRRQKGGNNKIKAYVINLDNRPEKWERIQNDFKHTSIDLERFSAIKHENGHIGCGNSFKALVQKAKDENMDSILILEDDCKPLKNFEKRWLATKEWLDNNQDKWNVFNGTAKDPLDSVLIHRFDNKNTLNTMSKGKYATMILIKKDAYDTALQWDWDKHWLFDFNFINNIQYFKNIFIDPPLALQYSGFSNTEKIDKDYTHENSGKIKEVDELEGGNKSVAYVINLKKREDRWKKITEYFSGSSIELKQFEAIEHPTPHVGIGLSIQNIIKKAIEDTLDTVLIFEDDNKPNENFDKRWQITKKWLDSNLDKWEIFLGSPKIDGELEGNLRYTLDENVNLLEFKELTSLNWLYINKKAYDKILLWNPKAVDLHSYWGAIDRYIGRTKFFSNLSIVPFLSTQDKGYSNIQQSYNNKNAETSVFTEKFNKFLESELKKEIAYINLAERTETEYIYPVVKNIFPNKRIVFENGKDSYDLLIKSNFDGNETKPFVLIVGEPFDRTNMENFNNPNCIARLISTQDNRLISKPDSYYLPFFINVGPKIYDISPFVREYHTNEFILEKIERKNILAYISKHNHTHRDDLFNEIHKLDNSAHALGNSSKTHTVTLPENWWDLPDIYKDYKFALAMENTDEEGYISEKIMNVYRGGAIPIFWGTSKVKEIFNPSSFIYVNDYSSYEECAKEIVAISNDKDRLEKMQNAPIFLENMKVPYDKYYDTPSPQWVIDIANNIKNKLQKGGANPSVHPIAVSTIENEQLKRLTDSAKKYNINIEILGKEMNTMNLGHNNVGTDNGKTRKFGMKLALPKEYLQTIPDDDIIIFTDAWDVIYLDTTDSIVEKYKKFNKDIVFGSEKTCWPDSEREKDFIDTKDTVFPYLNSGGYIGKAKTIRDLLNIYNDEERTDDQRFWIDKYLNNKDKIGLDTNAEIFLNTCATDKKYYTFNNKFVYTETNTSPSIIHANSSDKSYLDLFNLQNGGAKKKNRKTRKNKMKGGSIQKILINYTNQGMEESRKKIKETAMTVGNFTNVIEYYPNDIDDDFKVKNKQILDSGRGGGYWLWKPYFILKTLKKMSTNDILVYLDCDMYFISSIDTYINNMTGSMMVFQIEDIHLEKKYTKMDLFIELGCQDNKDITDTPQIFTSPSIWKKDNNTIAFLELWLNYCQNYHLISDEASVQPNFPEFIDNRHDQSILSCLAKLYKDKYNIQIERCPTVECNNIRNSKLPQLIGT